VSAWSRVLVVGGCLFGFATACASGRVRGGQGTEMQQMEEYEPKTKAEPPEGNVDRTSGPITLPNPPPLLEVDLERRQPPPAPEPEPEPEPLEPNSRPESTN